MHRVKILAILAGAATDNAMTFSVSISMGFTMAFCFAFSGSGNIAQMESAAATSPELLCSGFVLGGLCSVFGGFVTGRIARTDRILNGFIMGFVSIVFGFLTTHRIPFADDTFFWYDMIAYPSTPFLGALGAYFADLVFGCGRQPPPARP